jgi:glycosyltransferase involved in cell wall biosynthesis
MLKLMHLRFLPSSADRPRNDVTQAVGQSRHTRSLGQRVTRYGLRGLLLLHRLALAVVGRLHPRRPLPRNGRYSVLLTGTFYSENWILAHVRPLAASRRCRTVYVATTHTIPSTPNVVAIFPPARVCRAIGTVPARLVTFAWMALVLRPHFIGGFHLLVNGLLAALLARLVGARSVYFCVGGPSEVLDGGIWAENRLFGRLKSPDVVLERRLIQAVGAFDLVVTMGRRAAAFLCERGVRTRFRVVSGGVDIQRFDTAINGRNCDLILVGRLAPVKRVDLFLRAVAQASRSLPTISATIVGDGALRTELQRLACQLDVAARVRFVGQQSDVEKWLSRSRVFVLTSDSEGLALSLMEAMMCGLPPVVSDVGELADLVKPGINGYLVRERTPEAFAAPIVELLTDTERYAAYSAAARRAALCHEVSRVSAAWDEILTETFQSRDRRKA